MNRKKQKERFIMDTLSIFRLNEMSELPFIMIPSALIFTGIILIIMGIIWIFILGFVSIFSIYNKKLRRQLFKFN